MLPLCGLEAPGRHAERERPTGRGRAAARHRQHRGSDRRRRLPRLRPVRRAVLAALPPARACARASSSGSRRSRTLKRLPVNVRPLLGIREGLQPGHAGARAAGVRVSRQGPARPGRPLPRRVSIARRRARPALVARLQRRLLGLRLRLADAVRPLPGRSRRRSSRRASSRTPSSQRTRRTGVPERSPLCVERGRVRHARPEPHPGPDDSFCWSYSPLDRQPVLNATAKGARLLRAGRQLARPPGAARHCAGVAPLRRRPPVAETAPGRTRSTTRAAGATTSTPATCSTACTSTSTRTGDATFAESTERGWRYYRDHFFDDGAVPRYYDRDRYPVDATAAAQSLLTLCRFGDVATARRVANWSLEHLQRRDGAFAFQLHRHYANRIPYMRWSTAWMFCGLARVEPGSDRTEGLDRHRQPAAGAVPAAVQARVRGSAATRSSSPRATTGSRSSFSANAASSTRSSGARRAPAECARRRAALVARTRSTRLFKRGAAARTSS